MSPGRDGTRSQPSRELFRQTYSEISPAPDRAMDTLAGSTSTAVMSVRATRRVIIPIRSTSRPASGSSTAVLTRCTAGHCQR
jgi:hypothetical protein